MAGPKQKQHSIVDVSGGESKVWCSKEQYCKGTQKVRSMNQDKWDMVKLKMERLNINILGTSELKLMGLVNLIQMTIISTYVGKNPSLEGTK